MANNTWVEQLRHFPLPGTATLFLLDRITILGYQLPLDRPIEAGVGLDIEKRKAPGADYATYVSHGVDSHPIKIVLRLFKDLSSGKNWFENYDAIKNRLVGKFLSQRNAIPVYHPLLDSEGINSLIFAERTIPTPSQGQFFTVSLSAFNPKTTRIGSGSGAGSSRALQDLALTSRGSSVDARGQSKVVGVDNQNTQRPTARQSPSNVRTPATNQAGQARRPTGG